MSEYEDRQRMALEQLQHPEQTEDKNLRRLALQERAIPMTLLDNQSTIIITRINNRILHLYNKTAKALEDPKNY